MSHQLRDQILTAYDWTQTQLQKIFDAIPREHFLHQPSPGANHALWSMGHLATVDQFFLKSVAGRDSGVFERYATLFFAKSTPSPNADAYPPIDAVREYFDSSRKAFRAWIESLDDERLAAPLPAEQQRFAPNYAGMLMRLLWHEGMHYGQLTVLRKSLGLAPVRI
jgi:uncharacterized damage-inducible protein DinB